MLTSHLILMVMMMKMKLMMMMTICLCRIVYSIKKFIYLSIIYLYFSQQGVIIQQTQQIKVYGTFMKEKGHVSMENTVRVLRPTSTHVSWDMVAEYCIIQTSVRLMGSGHRHPDVKVIDLLIQVDSVHIQ